MPDWVLTVTKERRWRKNKVVLKATKTCDEEEAKELIQEMSKEHPGLNLFLHRVEGT
jgi:hypothetical protein